MSEWSFKNLNLSQVTQESVAVPVGEHVCKIVKAEVKKAGTKATLHVQFQAPNGATFYSFCKVHDTDTSEKKRRGTEIGQKRLKSILTHGGHPNPDNPGDINTLLGLEVGVRLAYPRDDNGNRTEWERNGKSGLEQAQPLEFGAFYTPVAYDQVENGVDKAPVIVVEEEIATNGTGAPPDLDDKIPF